MDPNFVSNKNFLRDATMLHVFVCSIRPQLLHCLLQSICNQQPHGFSVSLNANIAGVVPDPHGEQRSNFFYDGLHGDLTKQWIWSVCDDNMMRPNFLKVMTQAIKDKPEAKLFFFHQERHDCLGPVLPAHPERVKPMQVDTSMAFIRADAIGSLRCELCPTVDGVFLQRLYENNWRHTVFIDEVLCNFEAAWWYMNGKEKKQRYVLEVLQ